MRNKNLLTVYLLLILFSLSVKSQENNTDVIEENDPDDNVLFELLQEETTSGHYQVMIEYITRFFCTGESYRFNHVYMERSLSTGLAGDLINKINHCATASSLISR